MRPGNRAASRGWVALALALLLATGLRAVNLGGRTLWYDEAFSVRFAEKGLSAMLEGTVSHGGDAAEEHPLLYYAGLYVWMRLVGQSPEMVRAFSLLAGVATVAVIGRLAADLFGRRAGLVAALMAAAAPFPIQYAQETRMYALMALWLALATWCSVRGLTSLPSPLVDGEGKPAHDGDPSPRMVLGRSGKRIFKAPINIFKVSRRGKACLAPTASPISRLDSTLSAPEPRMERGHRGEAGWWAGFAVFAALSMYTQQLSGFYLIALAVFPLLLRRRDALLRVALAGVGALLLYAPWLLQLPGQIGKLRSAFWLPRPTLAQAMQTVFALTAPLLDLPPGIVVGALLASLLLIAFLALHGLRARRRAGWRLGLAAWLAFAPPVMTFVAGQVLPVYLLRALLPCALIFYVAAAWLFTRSGMPRPVAGALAALWIGFGGAGLLHHYAWDTFPNAPFDRAAAHLAAQLQPGDVIVHSNKATLLPMTYYNRALPQTFVADPPGARQDTLAPATQRVLGVEESACVAAAASGAARVWFVIFQREIAEAGNAGDTSLGWMLAHYTPAGATAFNDLDVYLFVAPDAEARAAECAP